MDLDNKTNAELDGLVLTSQGWARNGGHQVSGNIRQSIFYTSPSGGAALREDQYVPTQDCILGRSQCFELMFKLKMAVDFNGGSALIPFTTIETDLPDDMQAFQIAIVKAAIEALGGK